MSRSGRVLVRADHPGIDAHRPLTALPGVGVAAQLI
jgi:hypothetical protein